MRAIPVALFALALFACPVPKGGPDAGPKTCGTKGACAAGTFCERTSNLCVGCRSSTDCQAHELCVGGSCLDATACSSDTDCAAQGEVCDAFNKRCVDCKSAASCDGGQACLGFSCRAFTACTSTSSCSAQVCVAAAAPRFPAGVSQACQDCATTADCGAGTYCVDGICGWNRCAEPSNCAADPPPSVQMIDMCRTFFTNPSAKCFAENVTLTDCLRDNVVCGTDGKTDSPATYQACKAELDAYTACGP